MNQLTSRNAVPLTNNNNNNNNNMTKEENQEKGNTTITTTMMKALAAIVRPHKDVLNLHIKTMGDHLAFEFQLEKMMDSTAVVVVRIVHKVGYYVANGVTTVTNTEDSSKLVVQPMVLMAMLEPLKRSMEISVIINDKYRLISSVTFTHDILPDEATSSLQKSQAASLKTETFVGYDNLIDVTYIGYDPSDTQDDDQNSRPTQGGIFGIYPERIQIILAILFTGVC
jgi:hypothetical protein